MKKKIVKQTVQAKSATPYSIVVPLRDVEKVKLIADTLVRKFSPGNFSLQLIFSTHLPEETVKQALQSSPELLKIVQPEIYSGFSDAYEEMLYWGLSKASHKNIILLHADSLENAFSLSDVLKTDQGSDAFIRYINFETDEKKRKINLLKVLQQQYSKGIFVFDKEFIDYVLGLCSDTKHVYLNDIAFYASRLNLKKELHIIPDENPFSKKYSCEKKSSFVYKIKRNFYWSYLLPLKELKTKPQQSVSFIGQSSFYRLLLNSFLLVTFFALPLMSLKSGSSADEYVQHLHSVNVISYFKTMGKDTAALNDPKYAMHFYGASFDVITTFLTELFNIKEYMKFRHFANGINGWFIILFCSLFAFRLTNWRTALFVAFLLFFSPRFLGHSFNNPKDIPFALGYIMGIYYVYRLIIEYPVIKRSTLVLAILGIGYALSVRIGGLLLFAYTGMFFGLFFLATTRVKAIFSTSGIQKAINLLVLLGIISLFSYILGIILWPYGLQSPIKNPLASLELMTHYSTSLRQIFEDKDVWSDKLPWYYIPKYMLITTPLSILAGVSLFLLFFRRIKTQYKGISLFLIVFSCVFPVFYIIYQKSNVYGGWRHALFSFPPMVIMAGLGYESLVRLFKNKKFIVITAITLVLGLSYDSVIHTFKNNPYQYVYYNQLVGGVNGILGKYETDYYFHSLRGGADWLIEEELPKLQLAEGKKVLVVTNHAPTLRPWFDRVQDKVEVRYARYYERGNQEWDYAIFANSYISPFQLKKGFWPPPNAVHTIYVDKVPICCVLKRNTKKDVEGYQALQKRDVLKAITDLTEAINLEPWNETAMMNLAQLYSDLGNYDEALKIANKSIKRYPDDDNMMNIIGVTYLRKGDHQKALSAFNKIIKMNFKYSSAYYNMGITYIQMNQPYQAMEYLKKCIEINGRYKAAYFTLADLLKQMGRNQEAEQYINFANSL